MSNKVAPAPSDSETAPLIGGGGLPAVSGESAVSVSVSAHNYNQHLFGGKQTFKFVLHKLGNVRASRISEMGSAVCTDVSFSAQTNGLKSATVVTFPPFWVDADVCRLQPRWSGGCTRTAG